MKKIKCIETKNYKLTLNLFYDVIDETDNNYVMRNDSGAKVNYSKKLFKTEEELIIEALPLPKPVPLTLQQELNLITFNEKFVFLDGENVFVEVEKSLVSCGISELDNITGISRLITNSDLKFKKQALHYIISECFDARNAAMGLISINTNSNYYNQDLEDVLNLISVSSTFLRNPNSDNEIVLYVIDLEKMSQIQIEE